MSTLQQIQAAFRDKVGEQVSLVEEGLDRYRVFTPFRFDDGDHVVVVLDRRGMAWHLTDEGHTFMRLSYELEEAQLREGTRQAILTRVTSAHRIDDREGELVLPVPDMDFGNALFTFLQAIVSISDLSYVSRERIRTTFFEDIRALVESAVPSERLHSNYVHRELDPEGHYAVDYRINGADRPLLVFAIASDSKCRDATITLHQFERWKLEFASLGVFEDQEDINRRVLARFTDVCERQFSSLGSRERIVRYLQRALG